jgi:hypothetical protein
MAHTSRTPDEIKTALAKAQLELAEARKQYKAIIDIRPANMKDIRRVHDVLAEASEFVRKLEKELRKAEAGAGE